MPKGRKPNIATTLYIIKRDKCRCQYCGKKGTQIFRYDKPCVVENINGFVVPEYENYNGDKVISFEIDHIIPFIDGGGDSFENLALSCRKCNRAKGRKHA